MIKYYFIIITGITIFSCCIKSTLKSVGYEKLIPDSLICETLTYFVNDTSIDEFKNCNRFIDGEISRVLNEEDSLKILELDSIFTKEDLDFIFRQNCNSIYYKHNECLKNKVLIPVDTLLKFNRWEFWDEFHKRFGKGGFSSISLPLFSKNQNIVIIKYSHSSGRLNASGGTFIFKKMDDKWVEIMCIDYWIS